jgi:hypothetical protein
MMSKGDAFSRSASKLNPIAKAVTTTRRGSNHSCVNQYGQGDFASGVGLPAIAIEDIYSLCENHFPDIIIYILTYEKPFFKLINFIQRA